MLKKILLLFQTALFISCVGVDVNNKINFNEISGEKVKQISVVETDFGNSFMFKPFLELRREGPLIPGLTNELVPQGMAYRADKDQMFISNYSNTKKAGALTIINMNNGSLEKVLFLENADGTAHTGHLGGLAVSSDRLWISSGAGIYGIEFTDIDKAQNGTAIRLPELLETETKGSFSASSEGIVWVGEFTRKNGSYPASKMHQSIDREGIKHRAWLAGYLTEKITSGSFTETNFNTKYQPDFILSIPDEIQGAVITEKKIFLSASYGRKNNSRLHVYTNPMNENPHQIIISPEGMKIPLWYLDGKNLLEIIIMPPMSEGLAFYKNDVAILFESAAEKYRETALFPLDRIQILDYE